MTTKYKGLGTFLSVAILLVLASCSEPEVPPWTDSEMEELLGYFGEIGEAYALLDICMPMLEADGEAKYELVSAIKADRYAKLLQMDSSYELKKLSSSFASVADRRIKISSYDCTTIRPEVRPQPELPRRRSASIRSRTTQTP